MDNKSDANKFIDQFFYFISKIIFFLPIFFLIFGLLIKFNQKKENKIMNNNVLTPTLVINISSSPKPNNINFDLKGPLICSFSHNDASTSAYIKEKKIKIIFQEKGVKSYFLLNNDCLYKWQENQFIGNKSCNVNQYLNLIEILLKYNKNSFISFFLKQNEMINFNKKDFSLDKICKKEDFDESFFLIPVNILFKNTEVNF